MPEFGKKSKERLESCDERLQDICNDVIVSFDFTILEGHRDEETQNKLFSEGKSKLKWPNSKHNSKPSMAVDIAPYPIDWEDTKRFFMLAGMMLQAARKHGYKLRWGGDWDGDGDFNDQTFNDLPHFEIMED